MAIHNLNCQNFDHQSREQLPPSFHQKQSRKTNLTQPESKKPRREGDEDRENSESDETNTGAECFDTNQELEFIYFGDTSSDDSDEDDDGLDWIP